MAQYDKRIRADFDDFLGYCERAVQQGSVTASAEGGFDEVMGDVRVSMRVYERYSMLGSSRVAMSITLMGRGQELRLFAHASGGSEAMFFKINTWGEQSFLDTLVKAVEAYRG